MKTALGSLLCSLACAVQAQSDTPPVEELIVVGNRIDSQLIDPAGQLTVLSGADLRLRTSGAGNLAEVLAQSVPGMAPASQTLTNYSQTLRGRDLLVLVDGVPLNTNRDASRDLYNVDPEQIARVEVLRGGNAIYGSGATGGVVAVTTRRGQEEFQAYTGGSVNSSTEHFGGDALGYKLNQYLSGRLGGIDYAVTASHESIGAHYDADGERIAPEPSQGDMFDAVINSYSAKLGYDFLNQRVQVSASRYDAEQDTDYASDPSVTAYEPGSVKANAVEGLELDKQNEIDNQILSADYYHRDILGSELHGQIYQRDYQTRFYPFDARHLSSWGNQIAQSHLGSEVNGARLTVTTPLSFSETTDTELVWGADLVRETTKMPVTRYDGDVFDANDGLRFVELGDATFMPPIDHDSDAAFAQFRHQFSPIIAMDVGFRHEEVKASFNDFSPLSQINEASPATVSGGSVRYDDWFYNAGLVFTVTQTQEIYVSYNEGFELPDIGLQVRYAAPDFDVTSSDLRPITTENYEFGWRGNWDALEVTAAIFRSTSDLGRVSTENFGLTLSRNKERITGFEGSLNYRINDAWDLGVSYTTLRGEERADNAPDYRNMNGFRIPPDKIAGHATYQIGDSQSYTLQLLHSGSEDYRLEGAEGFGRREVDSYTTVDFRAQWRFDGSRITGSLENLLNEDYYTLYGQLMRSSSNTSHIPARGRHVSLAYTYDW